MSGQEGSTSYTPLYSAPAGLPSVYENPIKVPRPVPTFLNSTDLVTFHIGAAKTTFLVQKEVATFYSWVLEVALNSDFIEGQTQTYTLDDVDEDVFKLFIQWLYRQKFGYYLTQAEADLLRQPKSHTDEQLKPAKEKIEKRQELLVRLWVLGDRLSIPRLQNLVLDDLENIRFTWNTTVPLRLLEEVYENTVEDSRLRKFLLLHIKSFLPQNVLREQVEVIPKAFLLEYALTSHIYLDWSNRHDFRRSFHVPVTDEYQEEDEEYGSETGSQGYFGNGFH